MDYEKSIEESLKRCHERRLIGKREYGNTSFLEKDNLEELKQELYDTINYALFTIVKVERMQQQLKHLSVQKDATNPN